MKPPAPTISDMAHSWASLCRILGRGALETPLLIKIKIKMRMGRGRSPNTRITPSSLSSLRTKSPPPQDLKFGTTWATLSHRSPHDLKFGTTWANPCHISGREKSIEPLSISIRSKHSSMLGPRSSWIRSGFSCLGPSFYISMFCFCTSTHRRSLPTIIDKFAGS